jgi:hypothetical protein
MFLVACTAKREKGDLSVAELLKRGREFDGKHVAVIGYYVSSKKPAFGVRRRQRITSSFLRIVYST